jgi:hypothetical protein
MTRPGEKGCDAMYGEDFMRYKDIRDVLNEEAAGGEKPSVYDPVEKPKHYNSGGIEAITAIEASMDQEAYEGYLKGSVMKYLWRYEKKQKPIEDLKKARWFLDRLIGLRERKE